MGRGRLLVYLALLGVAGYFWLNPIGQPGDGAGGPPKASPSPTDPARFARTTSPLLEVPPAEMRARLHATYRLGPDRRCLGAVQELQTWTTGRSAGSVTATWQGEGWHLAVGRADVGGLPPLPDFDDCQRLLIAHARRLGVPRTTTPGARPEVPESLAPGSLLALLQQMDGQGLANARDVTLAAARARALVLLVLQSLDLLEMGDRLSAKAWAAVALAAHTGADVRPETALLAYLLGYSEAARRIARELRQGDPVRHFVLHEDTALRAAAEDDDLAGLLVLERTVRKRDFPTWLAWVQQHWATRPYSMPVLRSALALRAFLPNRMLPDLMPYLLLLQIFRDGGNTHFDTLGGTLDLYTGKEEGIVAIASAIGRATGVRARDLIGRFETELEAARPRYPGPVLDHEAYATFYRASLYSALYARADFALHQYGSVEAAEEFLQALQGTSSPHSTTFAHAYERLIAANKGRAAELMTELDRPSPFGAPLRQYMYTELRAAHTSGKPARREALRRMVRQLDSRPAHAWWLASHAYEDVSDLRLAEELARHTVRVAEHVMPASAAWTAQFLGDVERLSAYLADPAFTPRQKLSVVGHLRQLHGAKDPSIENLYRELLAEDPNSRAIAKRLAKHLAGLGRHREARAVLRVWLARDLPDPGLERVTMQTAIARSYFDEGAYESAREAIAPVVSSGKADTLVLGAAILERLGEVEAAETELDAVTGRYPQSFWIHLARVSFYWRHGRFDEAAASLRAWKQPITLQTWQRKVARAFRRALIERPDVDVENAFAALESAGLPATGLRYLAGAFARAERHALAFSLRHDLRLGGLEQVEAAVYAYRDLSSWKGQPVALKWMQDVVPAALRNPATQVLFKLGADELLWVLVDEPTDDKSEWVWLIRAYSAVRWATMSPDRRAILERYFGSPRDDEVNVLGGYLLGSLPETAVWKRATDPRRRAEGAYVVGLKRLCAGRYDEASDWFQVVQELASERMGEYHWSGTELYWLSHHGQALGRLEPPCGGTGPGVLLAAR